MTTDAEKETPKSLPPIFVNRWETAVQAKVGKYFDFIGLPEPWNTKIHSDNPNVVRVSQGSKEDGPDGAMFNPGGEALAPGSAFVLIIPSPNDPDQRLVRVNITVLKECQ
ncbi:hypothetical protein MUU72_27315 [Streptomyces sp. RS10V-4]|uniref:hypothetical protein n=1 Tax=Streptomyces rhizoryzae TaxID=2932493 RepID=UPI002004AA18|nr:hypothetical protein [Streptomyces rhizoryzae]MCK7626766.1 hypothetical protein [Streptomyces rhizoryzae]